jgi:uncharacterized alkaline shock family protein YloU
MTETIPDGPTDPRLSVPDDRTSILTPPGYGPPPGTPLVPPPPTGSPVPPPPPTEPVSVPPVSGQPFGGRVYSAGETRYEPPGGVLDTAERGKTTISGDVVERVIGKVVDLAADEVAGVHGLIPLPDGDTGASAGPVSVRQEDDRVEIEIALRVDFGHAVHEVVDKVRANVISQTERLLGLTVDQVNVLVGDVSIEPEGQ